MSRRPPNGSTTSPPARGDAIALIVRSRPARSSRIVPRSSVKSTVSPSAESDPPRAVALGEQEDAAPGRATVRSSRRFRVEAGDVDIEDRTVEQLVANGPADDVALAAGNGLTNPIVHRSPGAGPAGSDRIPQTSSYVIVSSRRACSSARIPSPMSVTGSPASPSGSSTASASIEIVPSTVRLAPSTRTSAPVRPRRNPSRVADRNDADAGLAPGAETDGRSRCSPRLRASSTARRGSARRGPARARPRRGSRRTARARRARSRSAPHRAGNREAERGRAVRQMPGQAVEGRRRARGSARSARRRRLRPARPRSRDDS